MLGQFFAIVVWTFLEYVALRLYAAVAPAQCRRFLDGIFPTGRPGT